MTKNYYALKNKPKNTARIISENRINYILGFINGDSKSCNKYTCQQELYVGDIVKLNITKDNKEQLELIERKNIISKSSNTTAKNYNFSESDQILATNIDQVFIFLPLDHHFSLSKLERYVLVFSQDSIELTIILSKKDLCPNFEDIIKTITLLYPNVTIQSISIFEEDSIKEFKNRLIPGKIGLFIGSSGAGKSTLINYLQNDITLKTNKIKKDGKGKHTTTSSTIIPCNEINYSIIDTPGFKGIDKHYQIDMEVLFDRIESIGRHCKFSNCKHLTEPKCAVKQAVLDGIIDQKVLDRYHYNVQKLELLTKRRKSWRF